MYGIVPYGIGIYGTAESSFFVGDTVYASAGIVLATDFSATSLHGTTATVSYSIQPLVQIGADPTNRECVANLQLPLVTSVDAAGQPQTSIANITLPLVFSTTSAGTVTGTAALTVPTLSFSVTTLNAIGSTVAFTAPITTGIAGRISPTSRAPIVVSPVVTISAQQSPFAYGNLRPSASFSATGSTGRTISGSLLAQIVVFGAVKVGPMSAASIPVVQQFSATSIVGNTADATAAITPSVSINSIFYRRIDGELAFYVPVEFSSKAQYGAVLSDPDFFYVFTRNNHVYVRT